VTPEEEYSGRGNVWHRLRASPSWYRALKLIQPALRNGILLEAAFVRRVTQSRPLVAWLSNPSGITTSARVLAESNGKAAECDLVAELQPDQSAQRIVPPGTDQPATDIFSAVRHSASGAGRLYRFSRARVWSSDGAVITNRGRLVADLSPVIAFPPEAHPLFRRPIFRRPTLIDARVAVVTGPSPHNLSHWFFGVLPRLSLLMKWDPDLEQVDKVFVSMVRHAFQTESLRRFGVPAAKVVELAPHELYETRELFAPSFVSPAFVAPSWFLDDLKDRFADVAPMERNSRIYVSRSRAPGRRVVNEEQVFRRLETMGFVSVVLEELAFIDQVALFKGAEAIVAPHGAGLSHLAFCLPGTSVIECFSRSYINAMYWCLADEAKLRYCACLGNGIAAGHRTDMVRADIHIPIPALEQALRQLRLS
jgi:hypothetical protein